MNIRSFIGSAAMSLLLVAHAANSQDLASLPAHLQQTTVTATFHVNNRDAMIPCPPALETGTDGKKYYYAFKCSYMGKTESATGVPLESVLPGGSTVYNSTAYPEAHHAHKNADGSIELTE